MFLPRNQSVSKIVLLTSVLFCVCDCGDWDDIFVYENVTMGFPWHRNWTLITTTEYITTTTTTTSTESPTTEQQQSTMNDQAYGMRPDNERTFQFLLPKTLGTGDSVKVSGLWGDNPQKATISLVSGYNSPDYSNVALEFVITRGEGGNDSWQAFSISDNIRELIAEDVLGPLIEDTTFEFDVTIDSESETGFTFDIYSTNASNVCQGVPTKHHLRDVKYLILTGDYEKVQNLQFGFA